jgi:hypothetical protein
MSIFNTPITIDYSGYAAGYTNLGGYDPSTFVVQVYPQLVNATAIPFIRENDVDFSIKNLRPYVQANIFFDQILVNGFSQRASIVNVTSNTVLSQIKINDGVLATSSYAYGEVLGTSATGNQNLLYINDNFITVHLSKTAVPDADFTDTDFKVNDMVYQTSDNAYYHYIYINNNYFTPGVEAPNYTFFGKVKAWRRLSATEGYLVLDPIEGRANTALESLTSNYIYNGTQLSAVARSADYFKANSKFSAGESLTYSSNGANFATVSATESYLALSSIVPTINTTNLNTIVVSTNSLSRDGIANVVGNNIYIVSGTNQGFSTKVQSVSNLKFSGTNHYTELVLQTALPQYCTTNSTYSLGEHIVDAAGSLYGIFHIPSETNLKWPIGQRVFTVTDTATYNDNNYKMRAIASYNATGAVDTAQNARNSVLTEQTPASMQAPSSIVAGTITLNDRQYMSQTFFTPKKSNTVNGQTQTSYGIFVSSIDVFFYTKPTETGTLLPFSVGITRVVNGIPVNDVLAEKTLDAQLIKVSTLPSISNTATVTNFKFDDPVYLLPETEYAIRLHTESSDYQVWTATVGGTIVDASGQLRRVSQQPYVGNFFKAMNASNWNPLPNQDLMFNINRAVFTNTGTFYLDIDPEYVKIPVLADLVKLTMSEQQFTPTAVSYELKSLLSDSTTAIDYLTLNNNEVYNFGKDINISTTAAKRRRLIRPNQAEDMNVRVSLTSTDDTVSPVINAERAGIFTLQNIINNAGISNNIISIKSPGSGYTGSSGDGLSGVLVSISAPDVGTNTATANVPPGLVGASGNILAVNIINPGTGYFTTPTITISGGGGTGAVASINGETDSAGGNILASYQTKIVALDDGFDSGDLIVRMDAIRPSGTDIAVYFKVLSGQDLEPFIDKKWIKMNRTQDVYSPTVKDVVAFEYRYNVNSGLIQYVDNGKSYPLGGTFKYFAVKIRLTANDPSVIPSVDSLKVIAVPGG